MIEPPLISIVIPTKNRLALLQRAVGSALEQDYPNVEIIVVDDGSTDQTQRYMSAIAAKEPRVHYIRHTYSQGGNAARNTGIMAARGEFIAGLDDDDEFVSSRLSRLIQFYDDRYSFVTSRNIQIFTHGSRKSLWLPLVGKNLILLSNLVGNQVLVKKSRLLEVGLFDTSLVRYQDYDLWVRLIIRYGAARVIRDCLQTVYYDHSIALNSTLAKNVSGARTFIKKHQKRMSRVHRTMHHETVAKMINSNSQNRYQNVMAKTRNRLCLMVFFFIDSFVFAFDSLWNKK